MTQGVSIQWEFDHEPLLAKLDALAQVDFDALAAGIGHYLEDAIRGHFDTQTLWDNSPMPESATARKRGGLTLVDIRDLRTSYVHQVIGGGSVEVGSDSQYAAIHHWGGDAGRGGATHIDPRPVLGVNADDEQAIGQMIFDAIGGV